MIPLSDLKLAMRSVLQPVIEGRSLLINLDINLDSAFYVGY